MGGIRRRNKKIDHNVYVNVGEGVDCSQNKKTQWTALGGQPDSVPIKRKLEEIDDEEFDIPPLFEDMEYEREDVPDLDIDEGDAIYKGQVFANKDDCRIALMENSLTYVQISNPNCTESYPFDAYS